jgi:hypothetical protein
MPADSSSRALHDYLKPHLRLLDAWGRRHLYALCKGILQSRSSILSRAGRTRLQRAEGLRSRLDNWVKRMSAFLEHLPWEQMWNAHAKRLRGRQETWKLVIHDGSDIAKPWAEKLEGLSTVHDGSTGELVTGYTFCLSVGCGKQPWDIHPIKATLLNPKDEGFLSQNTSFQRHITDILAAGIGHDHLHVFDRGFDSEGWFSFLDKQNIAWMIRLKVKRNILFRGEEHSLAIVAETILNERPLIDGDCTYARCDIGILMGKKVHTYGFVAIRREKYQKPLLLLVNWRVTDLWEAMKLYRSYLDRWEVEDTIRFQKQSLKTEQMQLRTFERLRCFLDLQVLLVDFLLREYDRGVRPIGAELREVLERSIIGDTRIVSPYLLAEHIGNDLLKHQHDSDLDLVPRESAQLCLLSGVDVL